MNPRRQTQSANRRAYQICRDLDHHTSERAVYIRCERQRRHGPKIFPSGRGTTQQRNQTTGRSLDKKGRLLRRPKWDGIAHDGDNLLAVFTSFRLPQRAPTPLNAATGSAI